MSVPNRRTGAHPNGTVLEVMAWCWYVPGSFASNGGDETTLSHKSVCRCGELALWTSTKAHFAPPRVSFRLIGARRWQAPPGHLFPFATSSSLLAVCCLSPCPQRNHSVSPSRRPSQGSRGPSRGVGGRYRERKPRPCAQLPSSRVRRRAQSILSSPSTV